MSWIEYKNGIKISTDTLVGVVSQNVQSNFETIADQLTGPKEDLTITAPMYTDVTRDGQELAIPNVGLEMQGGASIVMNGGNIFMNAAEYDDQSGNLVDEYGSEYGAENAMGGTIYMHHGDILDASTIVTDQLQANDLYCSSINSSVSGLTVVGNPSGIQMGGKLDLNNNNIENVYSCSLISNGVQSQTDTFQGVAINVINNLAFPIIQNSAVTITLFNRNDILFTDTISEISTPVTYLSGGSGSETYIGTFNSFYNQLLFTTLPSGCTGVSIDYTYNDVGTIYMGGGTLNMNTGTGSGGGIVNLDGGTINATGGMINLNNGTGFGGGTLNVDNGSVKSVGIMTLAPRSTAPTAAEGTIYLDTSHNLHIYLNGAWKTFTVA